MFAAQIQIPNEYLECGYRGLVICRNNGWINKYMDKLYQQFWPKLYPKCPRIDLDNPTILDCNEKRFLWASVVHGQSNASVSLKITWNVICIWRRAISYHNYFFLPFLTLVPGFKRHEIRIDLILNLLSHSERILLLLKYFFSRKSCNWLMSEPNIFLKSL